MNLLEFRKIVKVGVQFARPEGGAPLLTHDGNPIGIDDKPVKIRSVYWVPQKPPHQRRRVRFAINHVAPPEGQMQDPLDGYTLVHDAFPFELDALTSGALVEHVFDYVYPRNPTNETLKRDLMPHWERLTLAALGYVPNGAPTEKDARSSILFTAI